MDQNQTQINQPPIVKQVQRPVLVTIVAAMLVLAGIFAILGIGAALTLLELSGTGLNLSVASLLALWGVVSGIIYIVVAIGFFMMKKWALYLFTIIAGITLAQTLLSFATQTGFKWTTWGGFLIELIILAYLWSIRKQFV